MSKIEKIPDRLESGKEGDVIVTIPHIRTTAENGDLLVGLTLQNRPSVSEKPVLCAIGGFIKKDYKSIIKSQIGTSIEETGICPGKKAEKVAGTNTSVFSSFFVTDPDLDFKVHVYGIKLPFNWLEKEENGNNGKKLIPNLSIPIWPVADNLRFLPWRKAIYITPDVIARAAIAQLLASIL